MTESVKGRELFTGKKVENTFLKKNKHVLRRSTPYIHSFFPLPGHFFADHSFAGTNLDANYGGVRLQNLSLGFQIILVILEH